MRIPIHEVRSFDTGSRFQHESFTAEIIKVTIERAPDEWFPVITVRISDDQFPIPSEERFSPDRFVERFEGWDEVAPAPEFS